MPDKANLSDSEKLELINKRIKRMEVSTHIQTILMVVGFLGIISLASAAEKIKTIIKKG